MRVAKIPILPLTMMPLLFSFSFSPAANAQNRNAQVARAEQLFNEAKKLLEQNDVPKACSSFGESQKLDPQLGTLLNLALCHEREGKNASAWSEFTTVVSLATRAGQAKRAELAKDHARQLESKLARVRFNTSELPSDAKVSIDGNPVERAALVDVAVPIDSGPHTISVTAEGKRPDESKLEVGPSGTTTDFKFKALVTADKPPPLSLAEPQRKDDGGKNNSGGGLTTLQWLGIGTGAAGIVGIGVGSFFGLRASSLKDDSGCGATCTTEGRRILADARDAGAISTVSFITGGVLLASGILLYVFGGKRTNQLQPTRAGLMMTSSY
jgi:hypothetical protein